MPLSPSGAGAEGLSHPQNVYSLRDIPRPLSFHDSGGTWHLFYPHQICYVQAANQWCFLYTDTGKLLIRSTISALLEKLPGFIRPHRSYLVNPAYAASLKRYQLSLITGVQIPVSKTRYMDVKRSLKEQGGMH